MIQFLGHGQKNCLKSYKTGSKIGKKKRKLGDVEVKLIKDVFFTNIEYAENQLQLCTEYITAESVLVYEKGTIIHQEYVKKPVKTMSKTIPG